MIYQGKKGAEQVLANLRRRAEGDLSEVETRVKEILADVQARGDQALAEYALKFDDTDYHKTPLIVGEEEIQQAYAQVDEKTLAALRLCAANVRKYHEKQLEKGYCIQEPGICLEQLVLPLDSVGLYAPGGTAAYPSSVIMNAVPAKIAGVGKLCLATPAKHGALPPLTLVAAKESGVDLIFRMGGAQAVAAFAYGTETVPQVKKITGPGNSYVAMAKKAVVGTVGIDSIAGPSEVLVIADESANPVFVAADMLAQAEHDERAAALCVTDSLSLAQRVQDEVERQCAALKRNQTARASIDRYGAIVVLEDLSSCVQFANDVAPEHLEILTADPRALLPGVRHAGGVFLGAYAPEALGDYLAGTNHVLPTGGTAKYASPLGVYDFCRRMSVLEYDAPRLQAVVEDIVQLADTEGLQAHAQSALARF